MYETIEEATEGQEPLSNSPRRSWAVFAVVLCAVLLCAAAVYAGRTETGQSIDKAALAAEKTAYRAALTDPSAALRRARLTDFLKAYPQSSHKTAAKAQLQVIAQAEAREWSVLSHVLFDTKQAAEIKLAALDKYETVWDTSLLGGRSAEVTRFRAGLSGAKAEFPNRDLPIEPDAQSKNVSGDALAGGYRQNERVNISPPRPVIERPDSTQTDVVKPPRIRKNRRPKYPRRALERGEEAEVTLELYIDADGRVDMIELISVKADTYEKQFIRAAERAALRTRYHPQTVNGIPVAVQGIKKTYRFEVRD